MSSILNSVEQNSLLSVLENVETKRCPAGSPCPERDQLVKWVIRFLVETKRFRLFISEEFVLNNELINILQPALIQVCALFPRILSGSFQTPDSYFHCYGINYLFLISFMFNFYFLYKFLRQKIPVKRTRSRKFGYLKWIILTFLIPCYGVSYYQFYKVSSNSVSPSLCLFLSLGLSKHSVLLQEAVASRLAASTRQDPCSEKEWKMTDLLTGLLTISSEKTDCQRYIEVP